MEILTVNNLTISLKNSGKTIIDNICFTVKKNKILGVVGESGSGKSTLSLAIMGLLNPEVFKVSGEIIYKGKNILRLFKKEREHLLGREFTIIPQNPMTAFDITTTIGRQMAETVKINKKISSLEARKLCMGALKKVNIKDGKRIFESYSYQLSGGELQRVMIALCMLMESKVIFMDEITASIDDNNRVRVVGLINELMKTNTTIIFITHDLTTVDKIASKVVVMKNGRIIEEDYTNKILNDPEENYTKELIEASFLRRES